MEFNAVVSKKKSECVREYIGKIVCQSVELVDVINCGSFGDIYHGVDKKTGREFAVKFNKNETEKGISNFFKEYEFMTRLEGKGCFPKCSIESKNANQIQKDVLIMEKLGLNVYDLFRICDKKLSPGCMSYLIQQFIMRAKELHECGIVHRDIKPENFCLGGPLECKIYLIDFGLSKLYMDDKKQHKPKTDQEGFVGTPRYSSRHAHRGTSQSRRDDLEAIGYMCIFLMKGQLPWQVIKSKDKREKHRLLLREKTNVDLAVLCQGLPKEFYSYIQAVRSLEYESEPPYLEYVNLFQRAIEKNGYSLTMDWENKKQVGLTLN